MKKEKLKDSRRVYGKKKKELGEQKETWYQSSEVGVPEVRDRAVGTERNKESPVP
jgi:hypothetical protein